MAASLKADLTSLFRRNRDAQQYQMFAIPPMFCPHQQMKSEESDARR